MKFFHYIFFIIFFLLAGILVSPKVSYAFISIVSVNSDGEVGNDESTSNSISVDGRYILFESFANNLIPGDFNGETHIFVYDSQTGETTRVSVSSDGTQGNGSSQNPGISADGRYVIFNSLATNLVPGDTNGVDDIFLHDRQTGETTRVSVSSDGTQGNGSSTGPGISADGRYVIFNSLATNLVPGDTNGVDDIFVYDRQNSQIFLVSLSSEGVPVAGFNNQLINIASTEYGAVAVFSYGQINLLNGELMDFFQVFRANLFVNNSSIVIPEEITTTITGEWDEENALVLRVSVDDVEYELGTDDELATDGEGNWTLTLPTALEGNREYTLEVFTSNPFQEKTIQSIFTIVIPVASTSSGSGIIYCTATRTQFCQPVTVTEASLSQTNNTPNSTVTDSGVCQPYIVVTSPIGLNRTNNPALVTKIQEFLVEYTQANIPVTGVYDLATEQAVRQFQQRYVLEILAPWGVSSPTGVVYTTTSAKMNAIVCGEVLGCPVFTQLTKPGDVNSDVPVIKNFLNVLLRKNLDTNSHVLDDATVAAVREFQTRYKDFVLKPWNLSSATGWWYQTTSRQANKFMGCELPPITLPNGVVVE